MYGLHMLGRAVSIGSLARNPQSIFRNVEQRDPAAALLCLVQPWPTRSCAKIKEFCFGVQVKLLGDRVCLRACRVARADVSATARLICDVLYDRRSHKFVGVLKSGGLSKLICASVHADQANMPCLPVAKPSGLLSFRHSRSSVNPRCRRRENPGDSGDRP